MQTKIKSQSLVCTIMTWCVCVVPDEQTPHDDKDANGQRLVDKVRACYLWASRRRFTSAVDCSCLLRRMHRPLAGHHHEWCGPVGFTWLKPIVSATHGWSHIRCTDLRQDPLLLSYAIASMGLDYFGNNNHVPKTYSQGVKLDTTISIYWFESTPLSVFLALSKSNF